MWKTFLVLLFAYVSAVSRINATVSDEFNHTSINVMQLSPPRQQTFVSCFNDVYLRIGNKTGYVAFNSHGDRHYIGGCDIYEEGKTIFAVDNEATLFYYTYTDTGDNITFSNITSIRKLECPNGSDCTWGTYGSYYNMLERIPGRNMIIVSFFNTSIDGELSAGYSNLYEIKDNNTLTLMQSIVSSHHVPDQHFGYSHYCTKDTCLISALQPPNNSAEVFFFEQDKFQSKYTLGEGIEFGLFLTNNLIFGFANKTKELSITTPRKYDVVILSYTATNATLIQKIDICALNTSEVNVTCGGGIANLSYIYYTKDKHMLVGIPAAQVDGIAKAGVIYVFQDKENGTERFVLRNVIVSPKPTVNEGFGAGIISSGFPSDSDIWVLADDSRSIFQSKYWTKDDDKSNAGSRFYVFLVFLSLLVLLF